MTVEKYKICLNKNNEILGNNINNPDTATTTMNTNVMAAQD